MCLQKKNLPSSQFKSCNFIPQWTIYLVDIPVGRNCKRNICHETDIVYAASLLCSLEDCQTKDSTVLRCRHTIASEFMQTKHQSIIEKLRV